MPVLLVRVQSPTVHSVLLVMSVLNVKMAITWPLLLLASPAILSPAVSVAPPPITVLFAPVATISAQVHVMSVHQTAQPAPHLLLALPVILSFISPQPLVSLVRIL